MERTELFDLMGELKLYGMKDAFDEVMATAVKRQHEPQRIVGDLLKAEISYKTKLDPNWFGAREMMVGLVGNNLLNENIRNSVSYTKDQVLMPGIGVRAFANLKF